MALSPIRATGDWSERFDDNPSSRIGCNILSHPQQAHSERPAGRLLDFSPSADKSEQVQATRVSMQTVSQNPAQMGGNTAV
jgi:hypothetical protein